MPKKKFASFWEERLASYKRGADLRGYEFKITADDLRAQYEKQKGLCAISGLPIDVDWTIHQPTASLDRKESHRGYTKLNIQWVHKAVNRLKSDYDEKYFVAMCHQITAHHGHAEPLSKDIQRQLSGAPLRAKEVSLTKPSEVQDFSVKKKPVHDDQAISVGGMLF